MMRLLLFLALVLGSNPLFAQEKAIPRFPFLNQELYPEPSDSMPDWMDLFFQETINIKEIDAAFEAYYDRRGFEEERDGEEHNPYVKFYSMFRRSVNPYVLPDGRIQSFTEKEWKKLRAKTNPVSVLKNSTTANWTHIGPKETFWRKEHNSDQPAAPWQVNVYSFDIAPSNATILYAGTETGGVYKTTDKGSQWTEVGTNFVFGGGILAVAIHPTNPNIVYVSAGDEVFKTIDGGVTWTSVLTVSGLTAVDLEIHPTSPDIVLAATYQGLYRSTNGGTNWSQILSDRCYDIAFQINNPSTVFLIKRNDSSDEFEFHRSTNSGAAFSQITTGWITGVTESSGARLTTTAHDEKHLYIVLLTNAGPIIMKSTDAGLSWSNIATGNTSELPMTNGQGFFDLDILASDTNKNHVIVATTSAYRSTDGGANYTALGGYSGPFSIHPDIQELKSLGTDTWISTDGGLFYSSDFFDDVANASAKIKGLDGTEFWGYHQGWNEDIVVGGRYHNGNTAMYDNYPSGLSLRMGGAEAATGWVMHGRTRHTAFSDLGDGIIIPEQWTEEAEGRFAFSMHPTEGSRGYNASEILIHPYYFETYFVGNGTSIWQSEDGGINFTALHDFGSSVRKMEICRSNPDVLYVATDAALMKTINGGTSWTALTLPAGFDVFRMSLSVSEADENTLWILDVYGSNGQKVYKTTNGGSSWINISTSVLDDQNFINITHAGGTDGGVYVSSWAGVGNPGGSNVFYINNTLGDWQDFSTGLPAGFNPLKTIPFYRDGKLRMGGNRGAWETDLYESFSPIAQPSVDKKISNCSRDTFYFSDYSVLNHTGATWSWSFPGASYVSSTTSINPKVVYEHNGDYDVSLTIMQGGNSNTKTINKMVSVDSNCEPETIAGNAIDFAGSTNDYVAADPLGVSTNNITFTAWIKRDGTQEAWAGLMFQRLLNGDGAGLNFGSNHELRYHWESSSNWGWNSGLVVPDNEWAFVALVISPSSAVIYLNEASATRTLAHSVNDFDASLYLAADPNFGSRRFKGLMDEVTIWNRSLSEDEIRALRHLTRSPEGDPDLLLYYQFNELSGSVLDRVGTNHGSMNGATVRQTSTAPVGGGVSAQLSVNSGGAMTFSGTDITINFPPSGTYPDGELVVTKLNNAPDQNPSNIPTPADAYWIINNYGSNTAFSELSSIQFNGLSGINTSSPGIYQLYKRASNADGTSWGTTIDQADAATTTSLTFSTDNGITSFSQFAINRAGFLPVELLHFTARLSEEKQVKLNWTTSSELNNSHFEIEHSSDGVSFKKIGTVASQNGNTSQSQFYEFLDKNPVRGINYYRLKQVDTDEQFEYSSIQSIVINALPNDIVVYPNPISTNQKLVIKTNWEEVLQLQLFNAEGNKVRVFRFEGDATFSLEDLPKGWYAYQITGNTRVKNGIILLQ